MDLINIDEIDGELRVDSRIIATNLGVEHKNTLGMIRKFQRKFEKYGKVAFKTAPSINLDSCQNIVVCYLNEQQSTFLVTLSRNSDRAVDLKQKLTESYHYLRSQKNQPTLPGDFEESLRMLADQVGHNKRLEFKIKTDAPKVEFADNVSASDDSIEVGIFAKILSKRGLDIGPNRLFSRLKDKNGLNLLITAEKPMQYALDNKWLELDPYTWEDSKNVKRLYNKVRVTGKGQVYIEKKLRQIFAEEKREDFFKNNLPKVT